MTELAPRQQERLNELGTRLKRLVLREATDDQVWLAVRVCERYGFDPLLKHVVFISGSLYVTRDGLLDNAHRSGQFDGIEVVGTEQDEQGHWLATVRVWRKDMGHPFTYTAYQVEHENHASPAWKKAPRAMTIKCAEVMALRRAFNIALGTAEELGLEEGRDEGRFLDRSTGEVLPTASPASTGRPGKPLSREQLLERLAALCAEADALGVDYEPLPDGADVATITAFGAALRQRVEAEKAEGER